MSTGSERQPSRNPYDPTYRQQYVDEALENLDSRVSDNERRWLLAKGFLTSTALILGANEATSMLIGLI